MRVSDSTAAQVSLIFHLISNYFATFSELKRIAAHQFTQRLCSKGMACYFTRYSLFTEVVVVYLTLTDPLRIQPWLQDRRNQIKLNREHGRRKKEERENKTK